MNCGRPKGGLAILWRNGFKSIIRYKGNNQIDRVVAIILFGNDKNLYFLNEYLPCYNGSVKYECEPLECLSYIEFIIKQPREIYRNVDICICGDFNVDCMNMVIVLDY